MEELIEIGLIVISVVFIMSVIYRLTPYKQWRPKKPILAFFPKYIANYTIAKEQVTTNLAGMGFVENSNKPGLFSRGKIYGDFSAKLIQLHVDINDVDKQLKVYAPIMGVFFDTGDLWKVIDDAINDSES